MPRLITASLCVFALLTACSAATSPEFRALVFSKNRVTFEGLTIELAEPDDAAHPTAWQGPLTIVGRCSADLSLITAVFASPGVKYLIVTTYSGSNRYANFIDRQTCKPLWPIVTASSDVRAEGRFLIASQGKRWQLYPDRAPMPVQ